MQPLLTVHRAAQDFAVRPGYLRRLVRERRIPYVDSGLEAAVQA